MSMAEPCSPASGQLCPQLPGRYYGWFNAVVNRNISVAVDAIMDEMDEANSVELNGSVSSR